MASPAQLLQRESPAELAHLGVAVQDDPAGVVVTLHVHELVLVHHGRRVALVPPVVPSGPCHLPECYYRVLPARKNDESAGPLLPLPRPCLEHYREEGLGPFLLEAELLGPVLVPVIHHPGRRDGADPSILERPAHLALELRLAEHSLGDGHGVGRPVEEVHPGLEQLEPSGPLEPPEHGKVLLPAVQRLDASPGFCGHARGNAKPSQTTPRVIFESGFLHGKKNEPA